MKKRLMAVLAVFVLMPLVSWSVTLHVGDEKFTPSDKTGYTYEFSSCAARASYSESKGFVLTFWDDSEVLGNISWNGPGLNVKVGFGKVVVLLGAITSSSSGGLLEINGPGALRIINGRIFTYSTDVKLFGAVVEITSREGVQAISTCGSVAVELSCLSIAGYGKVMRALDGFKFIASMISVLGQDYSSGDGISHKAAIEDGNSHGGGCGGISIDGCVLTIVEEHHSENAGLYTRGRLSVYDSVVTIASEGECFHAYDGSSFGNVLMLGVSRGSCSVYGNPSDDETRRAFFADGKYVFGAATATPAIDAGHVEIDGGNLEVCAPDGGAVESYDFTMKDGSLKMVDSVDYSMVVKEMLAEGAVMGVISACSTPMEWTTVHSQILMNMILDLTAAVRDAPEGRAEAIVKTQRFCQTGGSIDQGEALYGCAMMLTRASFLGTWYTPAFCGGSLKSDVHRYDSGVFDKKGYYDTAPTNALGQTLTRVEYEPYWVYLNGGVTPTPTECKVIFNANGGQCSTTSRQVAKGAEIGTLPTATWSGYTFDGWYTSASGGTKVTATTKVTGKVTLYAHWRTNAYKMTVKPSSAKYGSVSGGGTYEVGKKVTLKAKAKSGYVFAGWYTDKDCKNRLDLEEYDNRKASIKYVMPAKSTTIYAKFITKAADKSALWFMSMTWSLATTPARMTAGLAQTLWFGFVSASLPTVTAKGLPKGMSIDKLTGIVSGTPTKPGKYTATVTVKSAAGNKISQKVKIYVTVPSGSYGTFDGYALVKTTPAYMTFTSDKYGAVSGKVTYKGKGYSFKANYSSTSSTKSKFTPSIKIGSKTYKPVTYVTKATDGITVSEARGEQKGKFIFVAQKKPGLVAKKKALAGLIGDEVPVSNKEYADAKLPKSKDSLTLKFAETDAVKVSGKLNGKSVSFSTTLVYCGMKDDVYTAEVALIEPKSGYSRLATFTLTVGKDGKVATEAFFGKIKAEE